MSSDNEIRFIPSKEFRAVKNSDGSKSIGGYAAVYQSLSCDLGGFIEQIAPGAFASALKPGADVLCLRDHCPQLLMGRTTSGTLTLSSDSIGLKFECRLPDTDSANSLYESISRGDLSGCSFGFQCVADEWKQQGDQVIRTLLDVDLFEVSPCSMPAYQATSVNTRSMPAEIRSLLESRADAKAAKQDEPKTKEVDGEHLKADDFLIVLDPEKTDTWHLPWHFSTDSLTKSHLQSALGKWTFVQDVPQDVLDAAWKKLIELCKEYGIKVSDQDAGNKQDKGDRSIANHMLAALIASRLRH